MSYNLASKIPRDTSQDPTHVYVDLDIVNSTSIQPEPMVFQQQRSNNFLNKANDYYVSCVRWNMLSSLPLIVPLMPLSTEPYFPPLAKTLYAVSIGYGTPDLVNLQLSDLVFPPESPTYVPFIAENQYVPPPARYYETQSQYLDNPYFYIQNVQTMLDLINTAIEEQLYKFVPLIEGVTPPFFTFDTVSGLFNLYADKYFVIGSDLGAEEARFYLTMNTALYQLLKGFTSVCAGFSQVVTDDAQNFVLRLASSGAGLNTITARSPPSPAIYDNAILYNFVQQANSLVAWSPVQSILFTTTMVPVNPTNTGSPSVLGSVASINVAGGNNNNISNTLTDFELPLTRGTEVCQGILYYAPTSEYRLFDLLSDQPLSTINIAAYWKDRFGFKHTYFLEPTGSASLKILFRKKDFNGI
jgi:hypothetical protein